MGFPFHSLLAEARDNNEREVDGCWAAEVDLDCVTASSTEGDSDAPETAAEPFLNKLLGWLLSKQVHKLLQNEGLILPRRNGLLKSSKNSTRGRDPEIASPTRPILHHH